jgi:hypothetical protein
VPSQPEPCLSSADAADTLTPAYAAFAAAWVGTVTAYYSAYAGAVTWHVGGLVWTAVAVAFGAFATALVGAFAGTGVHLLLWVVRQAVLISRPGAGAGCGGW